MIYFTILHWLALIFFVLLYALLIYLSKKETKNSKLFYSMVFASTLVIGMGFTLSIFVLEKYTKKAQIFNLSNSRLLNSEEMIIQGQVQNTGQFHLNRCKITIRVVNNALGRGTSLSGSNVFTPQSGLSFSRDKQTKENVIEIDKVVATHLDPGQYTDFIVRFRYPPHFQNAMIVDPKLSCR